MLSRKLIRTFLKKNSRIQLHRDFTDIPISTIITGGGICFGALAAYSSLGIWVLKLQLLPLQKQSAEIKQSFDEFRKEIKERTDKLGAETKQSFDEFRKETKERTDKLGAETKQSFDMLSKEAKERTDKLGAETKQSFDMLSKEAKERTDKLEMKLDMKFDGLSKEIKDSNDKINSRVDSVLLRSLDLQRVPKHVGTGSA